MLSPVFGLLKDSIAALTEIVVAADRVIRILIMQ